MNRKFDAICIGMAIQDIMVTGIPENLFDYDTCKAKEGFMSIGGDAANEAVVLSRLGNHVALMARVGTDTIGNSIFELLQQEPLDTSLIIRNEEAKMSMAIAVVRPDGQRTFLLIPGNDAYFLQPADITDEILRQTRILSVGSLYCLPGLDGKPIADILARAKGFGTVTICDMTYDSFGAGSSAMDCVFPYVDYMMSSIEEASYVTGETDPDLIADRFLSHGIKHVVLKLGSDGSLFKSADERFTCPAYQVDALDTTGCGDNFVAGFMHGLLRSWTHEECVRFGTGAGGLNATGLGAHETVKSAAQVEAFMRSTPMYG